MRFIATDALAERLDDHNQFIARFGQDTLEKMRDWVVEHVPPSTAPFILDIGTGNGNVLLELFEAGYNPEQMCGIDYSADAVRLAQHVAEARQASAITFKMLDFLVDKPEKLKSMQIGDDWDLILDKGTYDAMALAARNSDNKSPSEEYPVRVGTILRHGGYFLITCECSLQWNIDEYSHEPPNSLQLH